MNDGSDVSDLKIWNADGNELQVTALPTTDWKVDHPANSTLTIRYQIMEKGTRDVIRGNDYRTRMSASLFQMISRFGLVSPNPDNETEAAIESYRISFSRF